jgi:protein dithiol:quinone oxidoreductase
MATTNASTRAWLVAMALLCIAAVAAALVSQHVFEMKPCPWCVLQRLIFLCVAVVALLAAFGPPRGPRWLLSGVALLFALAGLAAALYQHFVAARSQSCALTLADKIVTTLGLDPALPALFHPTASCADAAVDLVGIPYEFWSLALFVVLAAMALLVMRRA